MPQLGTLRLEAFAALIALGWPPAQAAGQSGYGTARARRAATRMAEPRIAARVAELTAPQGPAKPETRAEAKAAPRENAEAPAEPEVERPPLPPIMSEEEWMTEFAPHLLEKWRASQ